MAWRRRTIFSERWNVSPTRSGPGCEPKREIPETGAEREWRGCPDCQIVAGQGDRICRAASCGPVARLNFHFWKFRGSQTPNWEPASFRPSASSHRLTPVRAGVERPGHGEKTLGRREKMSQVFAFVGRWLKGCGERFGFRTGAAHSAKPTNIIAPYERPHLPLA